MKIWCVTVVAVALAIPLGAESVPLLERITATASPSWETTVRGAAGAVAPSSLVGVGEGTPGSMGADGSAHPI